MNEKQAKYTFGIDEEHCFSDEFDSVEELIAFAKDAYEHPDGNYWDADLDEDEYPHCIFIGFSEKIKPSDVAPSLADIADQMTDQFYCDHNIDDDADVQICNKEEAEKEWNAFVEKYFYLPYTSVATWIGYYDLKENKWIVHNNKIVKNMTIH